MPPAPESAPLLAALEPLLVAIRDLDLTQPAAAHARLNATLPMDGPAVTAVRSLVVAGLAAGWLCPRSNGGIDFGRVAKAGPTTHGLGIDAVHMQSPGPGHLHPAGEVDLCFALDGAPTFDGNPPGWTVYAPGTWHVPTVAGGAMVILYFLPDGAIRFGQRPAAG
jgi:hypothetical protein